MQMLGSQFFRVLNPSLKSSALRSSACWIRMWVPRLSPGSGKKMVGGRQISVLGRPST